MSPKEPTALRIDADLMAAMRGVKDRDGIPVTVQIEKAVTEWLQKRGVKMKKAERRGRSSRKRS
jgi:hypothetical protein